MTPPSTNDTSKPAAAVISVVIADDHPIVRRGLRQLLDAEPGYEVLAEAVDVESAHRYLRGYRPDVLVIDLNMPGESTLDALPRLRSEFPGTQIVVLTMQDEPAYAREALSAGVLGYVLKEAADTELIAAVGAAARGESFLNPRLGAKLASTPSGPPGGLSEREAEVLRMLALGHTSAQIADSLYLSVRTVETHRAHIQEKLGVSDRAALVRYALDHKLVNTEPRP
jgi:two-component system, NarL family, response regulator NreC